MSDRPTEERIWSDWGPLTWIIIVAIIGATLTNIVEAIVTAC